MKNEHTKVTDPSKKRFVRHASRLMRFAKAKQVSMQRVYKLRRLRGYKGLCSLYGV